MGGRGEVVLELVGVDGDRAGRADPDPGDGPLAAAGGLADGDGVGHGGFLASVRAGLDGTVLRTAPGGRRASCSGSSRGSGDWATCGCSAPA